MSRPFSDTSSAAAQTTAPGLPARLRGHWLALAPREQTLVRGAALLSPRADFDDWAAQPRRFLEHAREIGAVRTPGFPRSFEEWARELRRFRPVDAGQSTPGESHVVDLYSNG